jgi:quercetin dioxygenase-like cupin family protein
MAQERWRNPVRIARVVVVLALAAVLMMLGTERPRAQDGVKRTDLQTHDLSVPGREVVQQMVELQPGVVVAKHTHPGEEVTVLLEGTLSVDVAGKPSTTYTAGQAFTIPSGIVHGVTNTGRGAAKLLATYIVEKGKPLRTAAP